MRGYAAAFLGSAGTVFALAMGIAGPESLWTLAWIQLGIGVGLAVMAASLE